MQHLRMAEKYDLPKIRTAQNPVQIRKQNSCEVGLSESGMRENVGLLGAYSH